MLSQLSILVFLLCSIINCGKCQVPFPGSCPEVNVVETFDLDRYMGTWYEYSKYPFIFEVAQKCQQAIYKNVGNSTVAVANTGVFIIINKAHSVTGTAKVIAPGQLAVAFRNKVPDTPNYLVLGTDYDNWVVVYSCRNITAYGHTKVLWILTRDRQPSEETIAAATKVIKDNSLSETFLIKSTQSDCPIISDPFVVEEATTEATESFTTVEDQNSFNDFAPSTERVIETA